MRDIKVVSEKTLEYAKKYLDKYGTCLVVRPTGFGKSYMLAHISRLYNKSLYVYPISVIKESVINTYGPKGSNVLKNVDFVSYKKLNNIHKAGKIVEFIQQYDLVMLDEVHMAGADGFRNLFPEIKNLFMPSKIHLIGVTATPDRADNFDIKYEYFKGKEIFTYTLHNCVKDGIMKAPHYIRGFFDVDKVLSESVSLANSIRGKNGNKELDDGEKAKILQEANLLNAEDIIKRGIDEVYSIPRDYHKFIVFFNNAQAIRDKSHDVESWFRSIYPDFNIETTIIHSDTSDDDVSDIKALEKLKYKKNTIQLIMCIDTLNMGYHVSDISGIIMLRSTRSDIIYKQQIGRCLSVKSEYPALIFDFVDNISIKPYFMKDTDEKGNGTGNGGTRDRQELIGGESVVLKDNVAEYDKFINRMGCNPEIERARAIIWWYTNRKAPLYVIEDTFNMKRKEIISILTSANIEIEDETKLINSITPADVRKRLYNARNKRRVS